MAKKEKELRSLDDLSLDPSNANKGTDRGSEMVESSLRKYGAGRSIVVDKNGVIIGGNKTFERALAMGLQMRAIPTKGDELVVVQRLDLDLSKDQKARELAIADNRTAEVGLSWDAEMLASLEIDPSLFWSDEEFEVLLKSVDGGEWDEATGSLASEDRPPFRQMTFTLHDSQHAVVLAALQLAKSIGEFEDTDNENSNGNALHLICAKFLEMTKDGVS